MMLNPSNHYLLATVLLAAMSTTGLTGRLTRMTTTVGLTTLAVATLAASLDTGFRDNGVHIST